MTYIPSLLSPKKSKSRIGHSILSTLTTLDSESEIEVSMRLIKPSSPADANILLFPVLPLPPQNLSFVIISVWQSCNLATMLLLLLGEPDATEAALRLS